MDKIILDLSKEITTIFFQMAPYLLFGLTIAGILHLFFDTNFIKNHLGKSNLGSVTKAALLGVPLPLCSCSVIPTAFSLRQNQASKGATISFLISTPQTGVDSILATYGMLGPIFTVFRPLASFLMGIVGGVLINIFDKEDNHNEALKMHEHHHEHTHEHDHDHEHHHEHDHDHEHMHKHNKEGACCSIDDDSGCEEHPKTLSLWAKIKFMFSYGYQELLDDIAIPLTIGIIIAGLISYFIPDNFFLLYLNNRFLTMALMIIVGLPLYICATASIPVAATLILKGISPGAALVFLTVGPATNIASIATIINKLGKKTFAIYISTIISGALLSGFLLDWIFGKLKINFTAQLMVHHTTQPGLKSTLLYSASIVFLAILIPSLYRSIRELLLKKK